MKPTPLRKLINDVENAIADRGIADAARDQQQARLRESRRSINGQFGPK